VDELRTYAYIESRASSSDLLRSSASGNVSFEPGESRITEGIERLADGVLRTPSKRMKIMGDASPKSKTKAKKQQQAAKDKKAADAAAKRVKSPK
jgi:hypothetical protein